MLHSGLSEPKIDGGGGLHPQAAGSTGQMLDGLLRCSVSPKQHPAAIGSHPYIQQQPQHGVPPGNSVTSNAGSNVTTVAAGQEPPLGSHGQLLAQQQHPQLPMGQLHSAASAGTFALASELHCQPASVDRPLARDAVPSFSGWQEAQPGQLQYPLPGPHPPRADAVHSSGRPHHQQDDEEAVRCAAEAAAVHCSFLASGQRARRKSTSDAAPHHPAVLASRRRKSDSGMHSSAFTGSHPACLAGSATSGSTTSGSGGSSPAWMGLSISLPGSSLPIDQHSCSSASSQQHHLTSILEGVPLGDMQLPAPGSPGWLGHDQLQEQLEQEEQQRWQQQHLQLEQELYQQEQLAQQKERELRQHAQLAEQKRLELQQLKQQQHDRLAAASDLNRHSPTPPSHTGGMLGLLSPKAALLHKQLAQDSSSAAVTAASNSSSSSRRAATEPPPSQNSTVIASAAATNSGMPSGRSPGAAAMVMTSSRGMGSSSLPPPRQQMLLDASDAAAAAAAHAGRAPPVARDISMRLQQQHAAGQPSLSHAGFALELQHSSNIWGAWGQHGVEQARQSSSQVQQQLAAAAASSAPAPRAAAQVCREVQQPLNTQHQEQGTEQLSLLVPAGVVVGVKPSKIIPPRSSSIAMSPAPPPVPPSPHQQLRVRRSSCSNIPGSWCAPSPRSAVAGVSCDHTMGVLGAGQSVTRQLDRASSSGGVTSGLTVSVTSPEPLTDRLPDSLWEAHCQAQHSPSGSPMASLQHHSGRDAVQEQRDVQEPPGFLLQQEQRLLLGRDQGPSAAAGAAAVGCGALTSVGSITEALDKLHGASSSLQFVGAPPGQQHPPAASLGSSSIASDGSQQQPQLGIKALSTQLLGPHKAAAAAGGHCASSGLPPVHPLVHQHSDIPSTPRSHLLLATPRSASAALAQHQQQPVPPKQHAPSCRSPCVGARLHAPASSPVGPAAEAWLHSSAYMGQHAFSPILEHGPYPAGSASSSTGSTKGSSAEGRAARVSGTQPDGSGPGSSSSTVGLDKSAASSSAGGISFSTDSSSGSRSARVHTSLHGMVPRPAFELLERAVSLDSSYMQQQHTGMRSPSPPPALLGSSRPQRALSPVVPKQPLVLASAGGAGKAQQLQRLQVAKSPSPPPMMASPRVGGLMVQPCPPVNSLPPVSPSPSVRTRVLAQPSNQAVVQQGEGTHLAADDARLHAEVSGSRPAWAGNSPVVAAYAAHRGALSYSSSSGRVPAAAGHAAMLPSRDNGSTGQDAVASQRQGRPQALLQPSPASNSPGGSGSGTPVVSWMQPARHTTSCLSSSRPPHDGAATDRRAATAEAELGVNGAAGWAAVVAFSHYRGRLGYLMNSGVVGVLFDDQTSMVVLTDRRTVSYIQPASSIASGAAGEAGSAAASKGKEGVRPAAAAMSRRISTDLGQSDQSSAAATANAAIGGVTAAAGHGSSVLAGGFGPTCQTFLLPAALDSGSCSSDVGGGGSSSGCVPEHLASKLRCLQRFVGCLLHHQPYSGKRHLDVTRLVLPEAIVLQQPAETEQMQPLTVVLPVHVAHFNASEGCVLLSLTDGSQQLVFMSDSSIMLLRPDGLQQLAFVPPPQKHKCRPHAHSSGAEGGVDAAAAGGGAASSRSASDSSDSDSDSDASGRGSACGSGEMVVVPLGGAASALPQDPRLLARLKQASRLPGVPPLFVDASAA